MAETTKYERLIEHPLRDVVEVPSSYGATQTNLLGSNEDKPPQQTILLSALHQFGHIPVECRCSNCQQRIITRVEKTNGILTWLVCLATLFLGCWFGCCLIPFCIKQLKNTTHYCPNCGIILAEAKRL